jgi:hypothetical protein
MRGILEALAAELKIHGLIDVEEAFIDGSLATIEKRGFKIGKTKRGKGSKIMAVADRHGLPVAICVESAAPHEVKLATNTLVQMVIPEAPQNLVGENAYDSDKLDGELRRYGIELFRQNRARSKSFDLRPTVSENRNLIGAVSKSVHQDGPRNCPKAVSALF